MARRCDRCRVEYESGADFGGYDYCMTCYSRVKQEAEQKRAAAARLEQQKMDFLRQQKREEYVYQKMEDERKERAAMAESRKLAASNPKKKREDVDRKMRERKKWELAYLEKRRAGANESQGVSMLGNIRKKPARASVSQASSEPIYFPSGMPIRISDDVMKKYKKGIAPIEHQSLSLSVSSGLPVSLSLGQKQVQVLLIGKNAAIYPITAGLEISLLDSQNIAIPWKATPRTCTLEPSGESKIKVEFDVPDGAARGRLSFTAFLKENAIYIDRRAAQSDTVSLSSQVKTPMDLQYKPGSASITSESLTLSFNNVGESGGILEMASFVVCFSGKNIGKKAALSARTKVKGGEKGILLSFAPVGTLEISALDLNLAGKDSNGKPYSLKRKIMLLGGEEKNREKNTAENSE